jgi:hypothetical protein
MKNNKKLIEEARAESGKWGPGVTATGILLNRLADALEAVGQEWEYGTALRTPNGSLWDFEYEGTREAAEWHVRECAKEGHEHGMDECVIVHRFPRVSAGDWVLVEQEGEPS